MSSRYSGNKGAAIIRIVADVAALILVVWILMHLLDANTGNDLVDLVHRSADWLSGWSRNIFTVHTDWVRTVLNYGIPAVVYFFVGDKVADRLSRA